MRDFINGWSNETGLGPMWRVANTEHQILTQAATSASLSGPAPGASNDPQGEDDYLPIDLSGFSGVPVSEASDHKHHAWLDV